jgi:hypothetical protein
MKSLELNIPTLGFIIVTRAMIGAGVALLLSPRIPPERRKAIGLTLLGVGAASTVPAILAIRRGLQNDRLPAAAI